MLLKDKVVIISGAGRGLGKACAMAMAQEGAAVALLARSQSEIDQVAREIGGSGGRALSIPTDVSSAEGVYEAVKRTVDAFGSIHVVLNNAAIPGPIGPMHETDVQDWIKALEVNLFGVFLLAREVLPFMVSNREGKIINVTSGLGQMVMPGLGAYSVAKAGVIHLTKILAEELRPYNIQVNGLDPGVMDTPLQSWIRTHGKEHLEPGIHKEFVELKEKGLLKPPEKVARLAVFLASRASDKLTGHIGTESYYRNYGYG